MPQLLWSTSGDMTQCDRGWRCGRVLGMLFSLIKLKGELSGRKMTHKEGEIMEHKLRIAPAALKCVSDRLIIKQNLSVGRGAQPRLMSCYMTYREHDNMLNIFNHTQHFCFTCLVARAVSAFSPKPGIEAVFTQALMILHIKYSRGELSNSNPAMASGTASTKTLNSIIWSEAIVGWLYLDVWQKNVKKSDVCFNVTTHKAKEKKQ